MHATVAARVSAPARPRAWRLRRVHTRAASEAESSPADASQSVVLGANGRTGREIVRSLLRSGMPTRACTRSGTFDARELLGDDASGAVVPWTFPLLQPTAADVTRPETVASAMVEGNADLRDPLVGDLVERCLDDFVAIAGDAKAICNAKRKRQKTEGA